MASSSPPGSLSLSPQRRNVLDGLPSSVPRVSSPLNPETQAPLPSSLSDDDDDGEDGDDDDDDDFPQIRLAFRGQGASSMRDPTASSPSITIKSYDGLSESGSTHSLPTHLGSDLTVTNRGRTLASLPKPREPSPAPSATLDSSWWGAHEKSHLPWKEPPKRKHSIPAEQAEGLEHTKARVALAVRSVLGNVADIGHELLAVSAELLELAPVPGLALAAKTLLAIWDAVQHVDVNFYGCLRLAERCANILISIRQEVDEAGGHVGQELGVPIAKLEDTFHDVLLFLQKQVRRPFLKRYLKRDEIQRDLYQCDVGLRDALSLFNVSVQIRILKQVQETERVRQQETQALMNALVASGIIKATEHLRAPRPPLQLSMGEETGRATRELSSPVELDSSAETVTRFITTSNALGLTDVPASDMPPADVLVTLADLQQSQNSLDSTRDITEIRQLMRRVIQAGTDNEILEILQVKDGQMPEAIKSMQRGLEKISAKPGVMEEIPPPGVVIGTVTRSISRKESGEHQGGLQRSRTTVSLDSSLSTSSGEGSSASRKRDTLNQEFIETGISALMRMSRGYDVNLPSWTITKYEVNREKQIGVGGFSKVYRGTWKGRTVAIKALKMKVTKKLFIREVEIWKTLHHPHIVELYGASSATSDPPWFFVSPYMKHGNLVDYLRKVEGELQREQAKSRSASPARSAKSSKERNSTIPATAFKSKLDIPAREFSLPIPIYSTADGKFEVRREWDLFRFMFEIAQGMQYLHSKEVLHGDLKASNVLVDNNYRCFITDFGQSEIKSEAYRLSGESPPHQGTMRWQAPEILTGEVEMTKETDVYAFSIACVEIVNLGKLPWGIMIEDEGIRQRVLKDNARPNVNESPFNTPSLQEILKLCWHRDPAHRPHFNKVVRDLELLQRNFGHGFESPKRNAFATINEEGPPGSPSPDIRPRPLPPMSPQFNDILQWETQEERREETVATPKMTMPEPVMFTSTQEPRRRPSWRQDDDDDDDDGDFPLDYGSETDSLSPMHERVMDMKNELRYRLLLNHTFHPSLIMPLWQPSQVQVGAVGFLNKPRGDFVTLFNAFSPQKSDHPRVQILPSIHGYGRVAQGSQKQDRHILQKGIDTVVGSLGWISRNKNDGNVPIRRRYTQELRSGHKTAYLCTESTEYRYMEDLAAPRIWFQRNIDGIVGIFGKEHHLQREDIVLVVGQLRTPTYGLFVSHKHPDGHVHFNVYASPKVGQPWGTFTTDNEARRVPGPMDDESADSRTSSSRLEACKVSNHGGEWDTVLIARLRFKPDSNEPTTK